MKKITIEFEKDPETGWYTGTSPDLHRAFSECATPAGNALVTQGKTFEELFTNTMSALELVTSDAGVDIKSYQTEIVMMAKPVLFKPPF